MTKQYPSILYCQKLSVLFTNFITCLFHKILPIMYGGVHFEEYYIYRRKLFKYVNNICRISISTAYILLTTLNIALFCIEIRRKMFIFD